MSKVDPHTVRINPFTTEVRFCVLNAMAFSTQKRSSVVKGLNTCAAHILKKLIFLKENCHSL